MTSFRGLYLTFLRQRGLALRVLLCWIIGLLALGNDEQSKYDTRFFFRGDQVTSDQIVLITVEKTQMTGAFSQRPQLQGDFDLFTDFTDSFFWNENLWTTLLTNLLKQEPKSIGVALYFGDNIGTLNLTPERIKLFQNPKVFWATSTNHLEETVKPAFSKPDLSNIATNEIRRDEDGVVRRVFPKTSEISHLAEKIAGESLPSQMSGLLLNYRGTMNVFKNYSSSEILYDELPPKTLKDKIIIIGAETSAGPVFQTPFGILTRAELIAHVADNLVEKRWIQKWNLAVYAVLFLFLTILSVFIITAYPQSVALAFLAWIAALIAALSAWTFDSFQIWIPAFSPFILFTGTWVIFIGYQATRIERLHNRLQQEQKALQELEQLKNNFVSLISHDLKTPIAKIQAVLERMSRNYQDQTLQQDLSSLKSSSDELSKYIQSIISLLRVESREFRLNKEVADVNEVIENVCLQVNALAQEKNILIKKDLEPLFSSEFDMTLIKEVILNIVENAIKYTQPGGTVLIQSSETETSVVVKVTDTGEGIKPDELSKVWGKFTRGSDQDLKTKGTGLGLYLVKYFIELHGGQVSLESQFGIGTTVQFTLPFESDQAQEAPHEATT